ncbi:hypothetical protein Tco_1084151 [Tanacetum coccineum]
MVKSCSNVFLNSSRLLMFIDPCYSSSSKLILRSWNLHDNAAWMNKRSNTAVKCIHLLRYEGIAATVLSESNLLLLVDIFSATHMGSYYCPYVFNDAYLYLILLHGYYFVLLIRVNAECVKDLKEQNEQLVKDLRTTRISVVSYKTGLESVEARLLVFKKNESVYEEDIKLLKREIYLRDLDITELKRKLELATKEKDEVQLTVQKFENSSKNLSKLLDRQIMDKCKTGLGYNVVPPPYTRNFMPPKSDLVYPSLDDFVDVNESASESVVEKPTIETNEPKTARKEDGAPIIED